MNNLQIKSGSISYETDDLVTITEIAQLAQAAELIGIPAAAIVQDIRVQQSWNGTANGTRVEIWWSNPIRKITT